MMFKIINGLTPSYLFDMTSFLVLIYGLRSSGMNIELSKDRTTLKIVLHLRVQNFGTIFQFLPKKKYPQIGLRVN